MRYNSISESSKKNYDKGGYHMSRVLANTDYFRLECFRVLKTKEGNVFVGHYITKYEDENEKITIIFQDLCKESKKAKDMTLEQIKDIVQKRYHVSIKVEEVPRSEPKPFVEPQPRKVFLKITQIPSLKLLKHMKKA